MKNAKPVLYAVIAAFGAIVVGINMGGMSGGINLIESEFSLSSLAKGFVTGSLLVGCLFGALLGGSLSDRYGRKPMLMVSAVLLALAGLGCWLAAFNWQLISLYRFVGGFGVGILSAVIPTYISEISPAQLRGTFVSLYQVGVVVGILVAYCFNFGVRSDWRLMLSLPFFFAIVDIVLLFTLPESPLWASVKASPKKNEVGLGDLFKGRLGHVVFIGCMLAVFQQLTGINVVINYAPGILENLGVGSDPLLQTVYIGIANLVFTLIALWLVDKFGRKTLLITGGLGCFVCMAYLTYAYSIANPGAVWVLAAIIAFIGFFALSFSPLLFVVTAEMYPSRVRGTAMALSTGISWACAFLVVQFYPWMEATMGTNVAFGIFAALFLAACLFIAVYVPETKGKTLEQIQSELKLDVDEQ